MGDTASINRVASILAARRVPQRCPLATTLRVRLFRPWYALSDTAMRDVRMIINVRSSIKNCE